MDLVRKFMFKRTVIQNGQLIQLLANIIRKINQLGREVDGATYLSLNDENNSAKDDPDWDDPLRNERDKETGAVLEEMALVEDDFNLLGEKPAESKDPPDLCISKDEIGSCRPLTGTARDMPAPNKNTPA